MEKKYGNIFPTSTSECFGAVYMRHHACMYSQWIKCALGYALNLCRIYSEDSMTIVVKTITVLQNITFIFLQYSVGRWHNRFIKSLFHCSVELKALSSTGEFPLCRKKDNVQ